MSTKDSQTEKPYNRDVAKSTYRLSKCCGKGVIQTNTTNDIICWECWECGKLTGVINELGHRVN